MIPERYVAQGCFAMKRKVAVWTSVVIALLAVIVLLSACQYSQPLPDSLAGLALVRHVEGDEASEFINRLHGKGVTPESNVVGFYQGEAGKATVYLSTYRQTEHANDAYNRMARLIEGGNPVFGHFRTVEVESRAVAFCLGLGRAHYFFASEANLYWLEVDIPIAFDTIRDLVGHVQGNGSQQERSSRPTTNRLKFRQQFSTFAHAI